ncbi:hypothetical protein Cgig2_002691 [Carnegiea gigantea]|uniref:Uncharacterized protein n=1 Tax=Carnegiea gigantea TaxID=171969 RepID=A0A9Q1GK96_9CARY|nr:hypothetical protein Cgig2_002691 [Carnegiea gigantea]
MKSGGLRTLRVTDPVITVQSVTPLLALETPASDSKKFGGKFKTFRERAPVNLDKMKAVFLSTHATSEMSFQPVMVASRSKPNRKDQNVLSDLKEHMGDGDEANEDVFNEAVQLIPAAESHSLSRSAHTRSRKHRSEGGSSKRDAQIQHALVVLRMREEARAQPQPSIYQEVLTKLREHPGIAITRLDFIFEVMEYIRCEKDAKYFILFDNDDVRRYLQVRGMDDDEERVVNTLLLYALGQSSSHQAPSAQQRLPKMIGGESGAKFIHLVISKSKSRASYN